MDPKHWLKYTFFKTGFKLSNVNRLTTCIFLVLSHGELGILYASDHPYKPENLWTHFTADKCPSLAGKPKMFFIQV